MKIFYHDQFVLPLPDDPRFPMEKYALLRQRVVAARLAPPGDLAIPAPTSPSTSPGPIRTRATGSAGSL